MHRTIQFMTVLLLSVTALFAPEPCVGANKPTSEEFNKLINIAGRQRMLSQKMSKEVLLASLNQNKQANLEALQATANLFETSLTGLSQGSTTLGLPHYPDPRIQRQIKSVLRIWTQFKEKVDHVITTKKVDENDLSTIEALNLPLLKASNKLVVQYEKAANQGSSVAVNLAGRQRMLSQKMSKELLLIASGREVENNKLNLLETATLFEYTLNSLRQGSSILGLPVLKDRTIKQQLDHVESLWIEFKTHIEPASMPGTTVSTEQLEAVATMNLPLLKEMNKAVQMFAGS